MRVSVSTHLESQSSTNTPPTIKHLSDSTLHSGDNDGIHSKVESRQQGQGGNPVETETEASDAEKGELSIHQSNNLLHKGTSPTSQKQRSEGKKAFLEDQDQEEEEKLDLLRAGGVGQANVGGGSISSKHQQEDQNRDELVDHSKDEPSIVQDPDSTLTIKSLSSSPNSRGEDQYQSEQREKQKEHSNRNLIQKDGDFVIFRDSEEISDLIMKGGNPFGSTTTTSLIKGKGQEVLEDDQITDENQKPEWLINILEEKNDSKFESNSRRKEEMNRGQDQTTTSSPYRKSSKSKSDSSSSPNKHNKASDTCLNSDSDPIQVKKGKGGKSRLGKVEERSEIGKGQSSSCSTTTSSSIIETRAQKKRKVTPKISVQIQ